MTETDKDLDVAIGHYAELLASNLHAQRAAHFPPDAKKVMRSLTSGEAAELLGLVAIVFIPPLASPGVLLSSSYRRPALRLNPGGHGTTSPR